MEKESVQMPDLIILGRSIILDVVKEISRFAEIGISCVPWCRCYWNVSASANEQMMCYVVDKLPMERNWSVKFIDFGVNPMRLKIQK